MAAVAGNARWLRPAGTALLWSISMAGGWWRQGLRARIFLKTEVKTGQLLVMRAFMWRGKRKRVRRSSWREAKGGSRCWKRVNNGKGYLKAAAVAATRT